MKEKLTKKKNRLLYSSIIRLGLAIGDWTKIRLNAPNQDIQVSNVDQISFDGLSKQVLKQLHHLHYAFSEKMTSTLSEGMNIKIDLHTLMVNQISYEDFLNSIADDVFHMNMSVKDIGNVSMLLGSNFISFLMDRILGGTGQNLKKGQLSDVELKLLNDELSQFVQPFSESWKHIFSVDDVDMDLTIGFKPDQMISSRESVVVFTFYLYIGSTDLLRVMVAYPSRTLRKMINIKLAKPEKIISSIRLKESTLSKVNYDVNAVLGSTFLTMNDIESLEVGDIIALDSGLHSSVKVNLGDNVVLNAQPCVRNNRLSCQILSAEQSDLVNVVLDSDDDAVEFDMLSGSKGDASHLDNQSTIDQPVQPSSFQNYAESAPQNIEDNNVAYVHQTQDQDVLLSQVEQPGVSGDDAAYQSEVSVQQNFEETNTDDSFYDQDENYDSLDGGADFQDNNNILDDEIDWDEFEENS